MSARTSPGKRASADISTAPAVASGGISQQQWHLLSSCRGLGSALGSEVGLVSPPPAGPGGPFVPGT